MAKFEINDLRYFVVLLFKPLLLHPIAEVEHS
jgi:hypothetical protein